MGQGSADGGPVGGETPVAGVLGLAEEGLEAAQPVGQARRGSRLPRVRSPGRGGAGGRARRSGSGPSTRRPPPGRRSAGRSGSRPGSGARGTPDRARACARPPRRRPACPRARARGGWPSRPPPRPGAGTRCRSAGSARSMNRQPQSSCQPCSLVTISQVSRGTAGSASAPGAWSATPMPSTPSSAQARLARWGPGRRRRALEPPTIVGAIRSARRARGGPCPAPRGHQVAQRLAHGRGRAE